MRRWVGGLGVVAAVIAVAGFLACRQAIGIDQYFNAPADAGSDAGTNACGLPYGTTACASCVATHCCRESSACAGDPVCAPLSQCTGGCAADDWACRAHCWEDHRPGPNEASAPLAACEVRDCATQCGFACGTVAILAPPDTAATCDQCLRRNGSCAADLACSSSVECESAGLCWGRCFYSSDCACTPSTDAGAALYNAGGGAFYKCGTACGVGVNWECVGHVTWPAPASNGSTLTVQAVDPVSYNFLSGVDVSACYARDPACNPPFAHGVTDTSGSVALIVGPSNLGNSLAADNYFQLTSMGAVPMLYYWGYPVSQPTEGFPVPVGSQAQWLPPEVAADSSRGSVLFTSHDCTPSSRAIGVQVVLDAQNPPIREYYVRNGVPDFTATESDGSGSGPTGGFVNVPPGMVTLTATSTAIRKPVSHATVYVRAGAITYVHLYPTP